MILRIFVCVLASAALATCLMKSKTMVEGQPVTSNSLDGVYELVSESTDLTKPRKVAFQALASDWAGMWQLQNGYYSRTTMKRRRDAFFSGKVEDLGFESFAGRYEIDGANIRLNQEYAMHPFAVGRSALKSYRMDGDTLTLTERLQPYLEDPREGTITTVLRRVK